MKKSFIAIISGLFLVFSAYPQDDTKIETSTTFPTDGKYEIITSPITMRDTFMLDRENGDTWQLVTTSYGYGWNKIDRDTNADDKIPEDYKGAVYQITMSGIAAKGTYLTNTLTGATWVLYSDIATGDLFWGAVSFLE